MIESTTGASATRMAFAAGVFDLDGVVTRSAGLHAAAWKQLFDDYLAARAARDGEDLRPFDADLDYLRFVDGRRREDGVRGFLASRGIELPEGAADDPPGRDSVHALSQRKNALFRQGLAQVGVEICPGAVDFIRRQRGLGLRTALVSSSRNAAAVLSAAGLTGLFDVVVDGVEAARLGLKGKPQPDLFLRALAALGVPPQQAFAVEDALAGVEAARAAGFGLVVGVDPGGRGEALAEHGADRVVRDLAELEPEPDRAAPLADALECYPRIERRLAGKRLAVFLDYDGTLTPIAARPELAVLDEAMRATMRELAAHCQVAIVSGRDRADVERLVGIDSLIYAGSHGFDIAGPGGLRKQYEAAARFQPALDRAERLLRASLAPVVGVLVERKRFALAAHYRLVPAADAGAVEAAVDRAMEDAAGALRKTGGKKVFELRPQLPWNKGRAVLWLLEALGFNRPGALPLYLGDDETDEDAFSALRGVGGIGVLVAAAPQRSAAHYRLRDTAAVGRFLRALIASRAHS